MIESDLDLVGRCACDFCLLPKFSSWVTTKLLYQWMAGMIEFGCSTLSVDVRVPASWWYNDASQSMVTIHA